MKKTFLKLNTLAIVAITGTILTLSSCSKEKGCMNKWSDNYSAAAEEDDASCTAMTKKFEGTWTMSGTTDIPSNFSNSSLTLTRITDSTLSVATTNITLGTVNFNLNNNNKCSIESTNVLKVVDQVVGNGVEALTHNGTITYIDGKLSYAITAKDVNGGTVKVTGTATK